MSAVGGPEPAQPPSEPLSSLAGFVVVRGAGAPMVQRRLPRRSTVSVGRRERHGFPLVPEWVPMDLATLTPVPEGWVVVNGARSRMSVESDWIHTGTAGYVPQAMVMLQRGEHRVGWPGLSGPLSLSVTVRSRTMDDQRLPYAVDHAVVPGARGRGSYLGAEDAPMSAALRYRLAVLFAHLIEGRPEPPRLVKGRAEFLGITEEALDEAAHRLRRRLNVVMGTDLQSLEELGEHLVATGELSRQDLDP